MKKAPRNKQVSFLFMAIDQADFPDLGVGEVGCVPGKMIHFAAFDIYFACVLFSLSYITD